MRKYDFNERLDWGDFQDLACRLIEHRDHIRLHTFKSGRDEGADGLWFDECEKVVVQAKRYKNFGDLYKKLKEEVMHFLRSSCTIILWLSPLITS